MVQEVTLPFSSLNAVPGLSGIEDVTLSIPQLGDVNESLNDVLREIEDLLDSAESDIRGDIEDLRADLPGDDINVEIPVADDIAEAVLSQLDVQPGLFGPIDDPFDVVLERAVRDGLESLGELDTDLQDLQPELIEDIQQDVQDVIETLDGLASDVQGVREDITGLSVPDTEDIAQQAADEVVSAIEELPAGMLLTDPKRFILLQIEDALQEALSDETVNMLLDEQ